VKNKSFSVIFPNPLHLGLKESSSCLYVTRTLEHRSQMPWVFSPHPGCQAYLFFSSNPIALISMPLKAFVPFFH
jgi:hypothetical protein